MPSNRLAGSIVRGTFSAGEPIQEGRLVKAKRLRLHGRHAAGRHARGLDRNQRRKPAPADSSFPATMSTSSCRAATGKRKSAPTSRPISAKPSSRMCACSPSTRRSRKRTARRSSSARPRRWSSSPRQAEVARARQASRHDLARAAQRRRYRQRRGDDQRRPSATASTWSVSA